MTNELKLVKATATKCLLLNLFLCYSKPHMHSKKCLKMCETVFPILDSDILLNHKFHSDALVHQ